MLDAARTRLIGVARVILADREMTFYAGIIVFILFLAAFGPFLAPYDYQETHYAADGTVLRAGGPSAAHPLGTNHIGQDVLSNVIIGARPTAITGLLGGGLIIAIGTSIGVTAGYVGGRAENVLMRFTDAVYGIPLIPTAIVLLSLFGVGLYTTILVIGAILWRTSARILRSQVLQIKERSFITAAKATGMSSRGIVWHHILPNIAPMMVLFFALGLGASILLQAGLAFIGVSDPFVPAWGVVIRNAYTSGHADHVWWSLPPGILISLTVLSAFMFGRKFEELTSGQVDGVAPH